MTRRPIGGWGWIVAALVGASLAGSAAPAGAVSISPTVLEAARKDPVLTKQVQDRIQRWQASKAGGVDRAYPQFALDMAKYPRGGVAHRNILVVLAQFPAEGTDPALAPSSQDTPFYYWRLFFSDDPNDGITSLREYYKNQSHGRLIISGSVTSKWLMMPRSSRYYANNTSGLDFSAYPRSSQRLAEDAMAAAYVDFGGKLGPFDDDGPDGVANSGDDDGYIDAVLIIHPGRGAELIQDQTTANLTLWSHEAGITQFSNCDPTNLVSSPDCAPGYQLGSVKGFLYVLAGEYNDKPADFAVGTYCHEFGHTLGLVDLYDPNAAGLGFFSLMALGNYLPYQVGMVLGSHPGGLDAWSRQYLGFDPPNVATGPGHYTLKPVSEGGTSLKVWSNGEPGTEYFLIEDRSLTGPDLYLPGDGMIVYHVNDLQQDNLSGPASYRVSILQADGKNELADPTAAGNFGDAGDPFPGTSGNRNITQSTTPDTRSLAGVDTGVRITNIVAGMTSDNADSASFDLAISTRPELRVARVTTTDIGGNGNGYPDPGETVDVTVELRNLGLDSGPLTLGLSSSDAAVTVTTASSSAPAIADGAVGTTATPFVVSIGSPATLPHDASLTLTWNDGTNSGSQTFLLTIGMRSGLADDFESGAPGWTHAPVSGTADEWHLTTVRAVENGGHSMKLGSSNPLGTGTNEAQTYAALEDAGLVSPAFDLPANSELVFQSWIDAETNGGTGAWDGGRVEISMNGGPWVPLAIDGGYGYVMEFNSGAALRGSDVFSGSSRGWRREVADLTPYQGWARIRFRFASDEANDPRLAGSLAQLRYYEGWYVDGVRVESRTGGGPVPRHIAFRAGPTPYRLNGPSSGSVLFRFSAPDGLPKPGEAPMIRIFDVRGREVGQATAAANPLAPSEFTATWNPKSQGGASLGSGIYFARLDFMGQVQTTRLVLVR
ncbi:MAG: M6 family metalloprotease domain-containing protein [Bacteroidota bacterium]